MRYVWIFVAVFAAIFSANIAVSYFNWYIAGEAFEASFKVIDSQMDSMLRGVSEAVKPLHQPVQPVRSAQPSRPPVQSSPSASMPASNQPKTRPIYPPTNAGGVNTWKPTEHRCYNVNGKISCEQVKLLPPSLNDYAVSQPGYSNLCVNRMQGEDGREYCFDQVQRR
jgi:hypothetical protein